MIITTTTSEIIILIKGYYNTFLTVKWEITDLF